MKKIILSLIFVFAALTANARGQFGLIGGLTTSNANLFEIAKDITSQPLSKFHAGIVYRQPLILGFAIQPALQYNMKGVNLHRPDGGGNLSIKSSYIELPVQIQWCMINILEVVKPYIFAEPFIGYAFNTNIQNDGKSLADRIKTGFEYGLGAGLGVTLFNHVQVSARYYWNLGQLYKFDAKDIISNWSGVINKSTCNGITASVAILF